MRLSNGSEAPKRSSAPDGAAEKRPPQSGLGSWVGAVPAALAAAGAAWPVAGCTSTWGAGASPWAAGAWPWAVSLSAA